MNKKVKFSGLWTAILSVVSVAYIFPILLVLINSFKKKAYISRYPFAIPTDKMFVGLENYVNGLTKTGFFQAFGWTLFITVFSVAVILLCTSMCAWYINRVTNTLTKTMYMLCLFSMVVPFQMVMFTLSNTADSLGLNTPWTIPVIYLGFGAGMAVFMFTGFIKGLPLEIEEAAAIDGASNFQVFFKIILPQLKTVTVTVIILQGVSVWNEYTYAYYFLQKTSMRTITLVIKTFFSAVSNDYGAAAATAVIGMLPLIIVYLCLQKYFIQCQVDSAIK